LAVVDLIQDLFYLVFRVDVRIVVKVVVVIEISSIVKIHLSGNYNGLYFKLKIKKIDFNLIDLMNYQN
jgi:hypothetical protein